MNLALVQSEAGKAVEAVSSLARGYDMAKGASAPPLPELVKEVARLQVSQRVKRVRVDCWRLGGMRAITAVVESGLTVMWYQEVWDQEVASLLVTHCQWTQPWECRHWPVC